MFPLDERGMVVAQRLCNLAVASEPDARVSVVRQDADVAVALAIRLGSQASGVSGGGAPSVAAADGGDALAMRLEVALCSREEMPPVVEVLLSQDADDEHTMQRIAVGLLDGLCLGLATNTIA